MEWICSSCCRQRIEKQRQHNQLTDELLDLIQYKPPSLEAVQGRVTACPEIVRERDVFDNLPLHTACSNGASLQVIQCLVQAWPASLQTVGSEQDYPLHLACVTQADLEIIEYLGNAWKGAFLAPNKRHQRPLHLVCARQPKVDLVEFMVEACPAALTTKDKNRDLPLHVACAHKASAQAIRVLLQANPSTLTIHNMFGDTPLHAAASARASLAVMQLLIEAAPATVSMTNHRRDTVLHAACAAGAPERVVSYLMDKCPTALQQANAAGQLPIHMAAAASDSPLQLKLLIARARLALGVADAQGNLPLHLACGIDHTSRPLTCIFVLFDGLPDAIRSTNAAGNLPLHQACSAQKVSFELVHYLMEMWNRAFADDDDEDASQKLLASEKYARGATVTNRQGDTALHLACFHNAPRKVIELLVETWPGALLVRNKAGLTPLDRAQHPSRGVPCVDSLGYMVQELGKRLFAICSNSSNSPVNVDHLQQLLDAYPDVAQERNPVGRLAIHCLLESPICCLQAIKLLVKAWPDSLLKGDTKTGDTPLHLACRHLKPVDHAQYQQSLQTALLLVHSFTVDKLNSKGQIALHVACASPHATSALIQALVHAWPTSVLQVDPSSSLRLLPWQIAQQHARLPVNLVRWLHDRTEGLA